MTRTVGYLTVTTHWQFVCFTEITILLLFSVCFCGAGNVFFSKADAVLPDDYDVVQCVRQIAIRAKRMELGIVTLVNAILDIDSTLARPVMV